MKVAAYLHPGIFPQGPLWSDVWIDILGRMSQVLHRPAGRKCMLISGARFMRRVADPATPFLAWMLERYLVPVSPWAQGTWLDEYLRGRLAASRAIEVPIASFVPIAYSGRLRRARIDEAPAPIVEPFSSPLGEIATELAESRRLIEASHGATSWQITAPMRALTSIYRAAPGKVQWVCRQGAASSDWASKPSFGNVAACPAKQGGRPVIRWWRLTRPRAAKPCCATARSNARIAHHDIGRRIAAAGVDALVKRAHLSEAMGLTSSVSGHSSRAGMQRVRAFSVTYARA
jgi:hypothetical protein